MKTRIEELRENLACVEQDIREKAEEAGRDPEELTLVAVSKNHPAEDVVLAAELGCTVFGENRVQELLGKMDRVEAMGTKDIAWHLIGTLQRNKAKDVVGRVALIHSVDRLRLIRTLEKEAAKKDCVQEILLQLNISGEETKHGFTEGESLAEAVELVKNSPHLKLRGLMTMAPYDETGEIAYPVFCRCREILETLREETGDEALNILSMGMSGDYPEAIRAGATHVRIGTAIFGARDYSRQ